MPSFDPDELWMHQTQAPLAGLLPEERCDA
jgi:hypothetical protein